MSKEKINDCHLALVTKCQFDYWYEKGTLGEAVKLQGNVSVLVQKSDFIKYIDKVDGWGYSSSSSSNVFCIPPQGWLDSPTKMLEIAIYENLEELKGVFNG